MRTVSRGAPGRRRRCIHMQLRVHLLVAVRGKHEPHLPELRRGPPSSTAACIGAVLLRAGQGTVSRMSAALKVLLLTIVGAVLISVASRAAGGAVLIAGILLT